MLYRKTLEKKQKAIHVRLTEEELKYVKHVAIERGWSLTRLVLESVRNYLRK